MNPRFGPKSKFVPIDVVFIFFKPGIVPGTHLLKNNRNRFKVGGWGWAAFGKKGDVSTSIFIFNATQTHPLN